VRSSKRIRASAVVGIGILSGVVATTVSAGPAAARRQKITTTTIAPATTTTVAPTTVAPTTTTTVAPTTTTTVPAVTPLLSETFDSPLLTGWLDGSVHGNWVSTYNGYGVNGTELDASKGSGVLTESPKASTTPGETHASLVNSTASFGDSDTTVWLTTEAQLRTGSTPNAWEVGWVLWHYTDDTHFYYFAPKPNGWELGKEDPAYPGAQRYLATGSSPTFPVGRAYTVRVRQVANTITVWVNGSQIVSFTDSQAPYLRGTLGLYNEDSHVHFDDVLVKAP